MFIIRGFVYSFTLAGSNVYSLFDWLVSKQCKQLFFFSCDQLFSSINGLRIVCLSRSTFLVVSFLGAGNSRKRDIRSLVFLQMPERLY